MCADGASEMRPRTSCGTATADSVEPFPNGPRPWSARGRRGEPGGEITTRAQRSAKNSWIRARRGGGAAGCP